MIHSVVSKVASCSVALAILSASGQRMPDFRKAGTDAAWMRDLARPFNPADTEHGYTQGTLWANTRFKSLLRTTLPQHQWFWYDHYRFTALSELIPLFMGVPGDAILDDARYVTFDGCLPHVCQIRGLLWTDTGVHPARLIFAAVEPNYGQDDTATLWLFSSSKLDQYHLSEPFLMSLIRWRDTIGSKVYRGTGGYRYKFLVVTIVQPNGEQVNISPSLLHLDSPIPYTPNGARQ